jgi:ABC-type cobalamin/Fe3+-siderophores transport system ATPase subunit
MFIGPNGSGKTAILQALSRMFDSNPGNRRIRREDFHVPLNEGTVPNERKLAIEADFILPDAATGVSKSNSIPACFNHMRLDDGGTLKIRFRLESTMGGEGDIEESLYYVLGKESDGENKLRRVPRADRNQIAVYYLPAKREPFDQIRSGTTALLGRIVRAVNWTEEKEKFAETASDLKKAVTANSGIGKVNNSINQAWSVLHKGSHFKDATVVFGLDNLDKLIDNLSVEFNPAQFSQSVDYSLLSDGQKSLLYLTLVVTFIETGRRAIAPKSKGEDDKIQLDLLNPPVFSLIAIEEPENSLSPHYLGRINGLLKTVAGCPDAQAIITTHSPAMLRRIDPKQIRHTRIGVDRTTSVKKIKLPSDNEDAYKFVREGLLSNPEVYFARFVLLGEGASEDIVLPKLFEAAGIPMDASGIILAQLGGRHVNYMWKLLTDLDIPYATLLDLDLGRYQGGWGRILYARQQLYEIGVAKTNGDQLPKWNAQNPLTDEKWDDYSSYFNKKGVFFSSPLDLDFSMIRSFPQAYGLDENRMSDPDDATCKSVLGKSHGDLSWFSPAEKKYFDDYHRLFKLGSKPASHLEALSRLNIEDIATLLPPSYKEMIAYVQAKLGGIYE